MAFLYVACGSFAISVYILRKVGEKPDGWTIAACVSLGIVAVIKDVRSSLRFPPLTNGNADALNRLMKLIDQTKGQDHDDRS